MMNKIEKLHTLFLSGNPSDWQIATAMCTETEFEEIVNLEVERLKEDEGFELEIEKDTDNGTCIDVLYKHQLILGNKYVFELWMWNRDNLGTCCTSLSRDFQSEFFSIWSDFEYDEESVRLNQEPFAICGSMDISCEDLSNNQYLDEYFKRELEAVKDRWRWQFNQIKAALAAV